jgi:ribosome-associated protein
MPQSENSLPDPLSKTQRKNAMLELQKLGEALIKLSAAQLAKIDLPEDLLEAVQIAHKLKTHEAIRRHLQLIGKKMRHIDAEGIRLAVMQVTFTNEQRTQAFHQIEEWRDKLISGGDDAIQELLVLYPDADRQHIRQLIRKSVTDRKNNKNTGGETELFRYLRTLFSA